jgi:hypothetical protein
MAEQVIPKAAAELLAEPRLANLRRIVEIVAGLPMCWEIAEHPRDGLRPCLTSLDDQGHCVNVHRHVAVRTR